MQASCPQCATRILIDDAKVPDRPFKVKCPKCQAVVSLPGRGASPGAAASPPAPAFDPPPPPPPGPDRVQTPPRFGDGLPETPGQGSRALVALADPSASGALAGALSRLGYAVDTFGDGEEGARLLEQGVFHLVATTRTSGASRGESLYQRIGRVSAEARRRVFLTLVGDEFRTGDGTQAWLAVADLVVHSRDVGSVDGVLRATLSERTRLYQVYLDARKRHESAAG